MSIKIALAGNPNCGKTTLFNELTGSTQYVGNWPGVTVEKKEGRLKGQKDVIIQDLPGIYSLSPYTLEEVVTRNYLVHDKPDAILNIIDASNIERNLYLTTQLLEIGIPMVIALNMMDVVSKNGDIIDKERLSKEFGCPVVEMSALKSQGVMEAAKKCIEVASEKKHTERPHVFTGSVEHALAHIEESIQEKVAKENIRWYSIKIFERDVEAYKELNIDEDVLSHMQDHIKDCEKEMDDDAESIITNQRYEYIQSIVKTAVIKKKRSDSVTTSDKIDKILTNRILALPIFFIIMFLVYTISMSGLGASLTDWANDGLFGEGFYLFGSEETSSGIFVPGIPSIVDGFLTACGAADWLKSLVLDGIVAGVGTVLGFVPQMAILFLFLSILEDSGYMARVAFIFDRVFRRFGLSGKSFIPMLIGTGCGVPAIMAARTIEEEKDRRMTIILSTFIPCGAKMEIVLVLSAAFFSGNSLVATSMYFIGILIVILGGIALKKLNYFSGDPAPFVMELPAYHFPSLKGVFIHVWERVKAFMIKAGTIIFIVCVILWFLMNFNFGLQMVALEESMLKSIGDCIAWVFSPLGFGTWQGAVASVSAELAKEQATATLAMLAATGQEMEETKAMLTIFNNNSIAALSFMIFNLFNAPCLVAIVTAFREQGDLKWGWFTFIFQMLVGYCLALCVYQYGMVAFGGASFGFWTVVAVLITIFAAIMVLRPSKAR